MPRKKEKRKRTATRSKWAEVRQSETHGRGMFATKRIPQDTSIIEYVGKRLNKKKSTERGNAQWDEAQQTGVGAVYIFIINDDYDIDGNFEWNTARLINHSCDPNCEAQVDDDDRIWLVALREIRKGEELTFNYGFDLEDYESHPCLCGSDRCVGYIAGEEYWEELKKLERERKRKKKAKKSA